MSGAISSARAQLKSNLVSPLVTSGRWASCRTILLSKRTEHGGVFGTHCIPPACGGAVSAVVGLEHLSPALPFWPSTDGEANQLSHWASLKSVAFRMVNVPLTSSRADQTSRVIGALLGGPERPLDEVGAGVFRVISRTSVLERSAYPCPALCVSVLNESGALFRSANDEA